MSEDNTITDSVSVAPTIDSTAPSTAETSTSIQVYPQTQQQLGNDDGTFTKFPELAMELRLMIWSHAMPGPRTVNIWSDRSKSRDITDAFPQSVPVLLQVNKEARSEAQKKYRLSFGELFGIRGRPVYFDFTQDTLLFEDSVAFAHFFCFYPQVCRDKDQHRERDFCLKNLRYLATRNCLFHYSYAVVSSSSSLRSVVFVDNLHITHREYTPDITGAGIRYDETNYIEEIHSDCTSSALARGQLDYKLPQIIGLDSLEFEKHFPSQPAFGRHEQTWIREISFSPFGSEDFYF